MAYTSEIEKLERRYAENPKGRNFAPLADAYRKAGQVDQAMELCRSGLEHHPDYISAHIVYGRCFLDQKDDAGAEEVFRRVLGLDPENVIAFKVLAEIAERGGRYGDAVEWLTKLLAADPMNGDAAEALAVAKGKAAQMAKPQAPAIEPAPLEPAHPSLAETTIETMPPAPPPPTAPLISAVAESDEFVVEQLTVDAITPTASGASPSPDLETFDGTIDFSSVAHSAAKTEGLEVEEDVVLKPTEMPIEGLVGLARTQYEGSGMFKVDTQPSTPPLEVPEPPAADALPEVSAQAEEEDLPQVDLPLIMPDDVTSAPTRRSVSVQQPVFPEPVEETPEPAPAPIMEAEPPPPPPPAPAAPSRPSTPARVSAAVAAAVALSDDDGAADAAALSRAEPVLTETMAELYLKQGHDEDALRVYQALLSQRPSDARLRARVDALTRGPDSPPASGVSIRAFLQSVLAGRPVTLFAAPTAATPAAVPLEGRPAPSSLDAAFAERPSEAVTSPGSPTRAAEDHISLDQVFGDEGSRRSSAASSVEAATSAVPAPKPAAPAAGTTGGFSFDDFFGAGGAPAPGTPPAPKAAARATNPRGRPSVEEEGDLDQFQAWLKSLKS